MNSLDHVKLQISALIAEIDPTYTGDPSQQLSSLNLDSFDFLSLRAALQESVGLVYSDEDWVKITSVKNFFEYGKKHNVDNIVPDEIPQNANERNYQINMPQMATGGLGESWFYKEVGDMHWRLLAKSLGLDTDKILDESNDRLYATFVRIKYISNSSFQEFSENENISLDLKMSRFGAFFLSDNYLKSHNKNINSQLVTSFVSRGKNNRDLKKSQPKESVKLPVHLHSNRPQFLEEYYQLRKKEISEVELLGFRFNINSKVLFETEYNINPYTDLNGVNLLYFAAYPLIFDYCERQYVRSIQSGKILKDDWGISTSSLAKDIHYLGNADINEALVFKLSTFEINEGRIYSHGSLYRKSDSELVAHIFSVKKIHGEINE